MKLHPIPPGLWCVPSAIYAIAGADPESVIFPALNRHSVKADSLLRMVTGATVNAAVATLAELDYRCRRYTADNKRAQVTTWARRSAEKYPGRTLILFTKTHALVAQDGRVYDNWCPHGPMGVEHPYAKTLVTSIYLAEKNV